jgi:hypothetical protein
MPLFCDFFILSLKNDDEISKKIFKKVFVALLKTYVLLNFNCFPTFDDFRKN